MLLALSKEHHCFEINLEGTIKRNNTTHFKCTSDLRYVSHNNFEKFMQPLATILPAYKRHDPGVESRGHKNESRYEEYFTSISIIIILS